MPAGQDFYARCCLNSFTFQIWTVSIACHSAFFGNCKASAFRCRFGLAPIIQRDLPYLTCKKNRPTKIPLQEAEEEVSGPVIMGKISRAPRNKQSPGVKQKFGKAALFPARLECQGTRHKHAQNDFGYRHSSELMQGAVAEAGTVQ